jgi:diguanylate cyclase (GGDEF)-like protein/PAS domain S-box-containing protein
MFKRFATVNALGAATYLLAAVVGYWACLGNAQLLTAKPAFGVAVVWAWFCPTSLAGVGIAAAASFLFGLHAGVTDAVLFGLSQTAGAVVVRPAFNYLVRTFRVPGRIDTPVSWLCLGLAVMSGAAIGAAGNLFHLPGLGEPFVNRVGFFTLAGAATAMTALGAGLHIAERRKRRVTGVDLRNFSLTGVALVAMAGLSPWLMSNGTLGLASALVLAGGILLLDGASFCVLTFFLQLTSAHVSAAFAPGHLLSLGYRVGVPLFILSLLGLVLISLRERGVWLTRELDTQTRHAAAVLAALPDIVTIDNRAGEVQLILSETDSLPGVPCNLEGRNVHDFMPPEFAETKIALVQRVIDTQKAEALQIPYTFEGRVCWVEVRAVPYTDELCLVVARNITTEHAALEKLAASEQHNRSVVEALSELVIVLDADGIPVEDLSGPNAPRVAPDKHWLHQPLSSFLPEEAATQMLETVTAVLRDQKARTIELRFDVLGETNWYETRVVPYGKERVLAAARDVSAERRAQHEARQHARMGHLVEHNIRDVLILQDIYGRFEHVSPSARAMFGLEPDWLTEARFFERVPHASLQLLLSARAEIVAGTRDAARLEFQFRHHNGELVWISQDLVAARGDTGEVTHVLWVARDITGQKESDDQMRLARTAVDGVREGILISDSEGVIRYVNQRFTDITGFAPEDVLNRNEADVLVTDFTPEHRLQERGIALAEEGAWAGELMTRRQDGTPFSEHRTTSTVETEDGSLMFLNLISDLSEQREREEMLWQASTHDALTNLPTNTFLLEALEHAGKHARKAKKKFAVLTVGLNRFGQVSESYGRRQAEELLKQVAQRLTDGLRDEDTVAKLSDTVFAVLSEEMRGVAEISGQATRLLKLFEKPFLLADEEVYESPSIGISVFPEHSEDPEELLTRSRSALEEARKASGTPTYRFYSTSLHSVERERIRLETNLRRALLDGTELSLAYQPLLSFSTGKIEGFEALCRWTSERLGEVAPEVFIPVAEASGLINDLGAWSVDAACQRLKVWQSAGLRRTSVAVNLSPKQLRASMLVPQIVSALERAELDPRLLQLEITEASLKDGLEQATGVLRQLKEVGVQLILDDFGTGYSNLTQLQDLPLDGLKIGRKFVSKLESDSSAVAICEAVINLAHAMGLRTIAKAVETQGQHSVLKELGCDTFQGYLFSPAVTEGEARALLLS